MLLQKLNISSKRVELLPIFVDEVEFPSLEKYQSYLPAVADSLTSFGSFVVQAENYG